MAAPPDAEPYPKAYFYKRVVQAKLFIDAHFASPLNVDEISREAHYSKYHFIREFRAIHGRTPREHLTHCRVQRARQLLAEGAQVLDACIAVGFNSLSSFSRAFKRAAGSSPAAFREAALKRQHQGKAAPLAFIPDCFSAKHAPGEE